LALLDDSPARFVQPRVSLSQFVNALGLNAEMVEARLPPARRDGEIDSRIVKHPLRVIRFDNARLRSEQRRLKADGLL
jgi:hypothetical protein